MILMTFYIQGSHLLGHTVIVKTKNKEKIKISNNETASRYVSTSVCPYSKFILFWKRSNVNENYIW